LSSGADLLIASSPPEETVMPVCHHRAMSSVSVEEVGPDEFRLQLTAGTTPLDATISRLGHEPNGPFWEGIAELIVTAEAPALAGRFWAESEADTFLVRQPPFVIMAEAGGNRAATA
jgi:hypothetical protein